MTTADRGHWLFQQMARRAEREAIVENGVALCYAQLCSNIEEWWGALDRLRVPPGAVVGIAGDGTVGACALLLALALSRRVAAPLPATSGHFVHYAGLAAAEAVIELHGPGRWSWSRRTPDERPALLQSLAERGTGGIVVFTSGSTGEPKAGLFDFTNLCERYREPRRGYRSLQFLHHDHLGGIHTMLHALAHGGAVVAVGDRCADAVCAAIERHRIELLPATPTFLRMLALSGACCRYDLSSLQLITYGTEPMPAATLNALTALFPGVRFKQTYGLSELGVLPTRSRGPGSLWLQLGGIGCETRIVDNVLWIRSETAMLGYLNAPSPFDEHGWYNTEDAVEADGGFLRILGRASDLINVAGQKVYPAEIENVLLAMDNVDEATVWGRPSPVTGQIVAARLSLGQPEPLESLEARLHRFCRERLAPYKVPLYIEIVEGGHHGRRFKKIRPGAAGEPPWLGRSS